MRATLIALGLAAVLSTTSAQAARFTWVAPADAISFDPHALNDTFSQALVNNVYEALVRTAPTSRSARRWPRAEKRRSRRAGGSISAPG